MFGVSGGHGLGLLEILFVFLFVDLFDNIGTLVAVTKRAGLMDEAGRIPGLNRILMTDATATIVGSLAGTSTVTSYVESAAGVQAGGRTGLTAVVTGLLFLATMFVAPYAQLVPIAATAPALIIVGGLMLLPLKEIDWDDAGEAIPCFLTVALIPLTFSIANGLAFGIVAHAALKLVRGTLARSDWLLLVLAGLFVFRFVWMGGARMIRAVWVAAAALVAAVCTPALAQKLDETPRTAVMTAFAPEWNALVPMVDAPHEYHVNGHDDPGGEDRGQAGGADRERRFDGQRGDDDAAAARSVSRSGGSCFPGLPAGSIPRSISATSSCPSAGTSTWKSRSRGGCPMAAGSRPSSGPTDRWRITGCCSRAMCVSAMPPNRCGATAGSKRIRRCWRLRAPPGRTLS